MTLLTEPLVTCTLLIIYHPFLVRLNINPQQSYSKYCDISDIGVRVKNINVLFCHEPPAPAELQNETKEHMNEVRMDFKSTLRIIIENNS